MSRLLHIRVNVKKKSLKSKIHTKRSKLVRENLLTPYIFRISFVEINWTLPEGMFTC